MKDVRITAEEAKMYAAGAMSVGLPLSFNFFRLFKGTALERARQLELYQGDLSEKEIKLIRSHMADKPAK